MARKYNKKRSRKTFRRKTRGRRPQTLKRKITLILNKKIETKYHDIAQENVQLWHNIGYSPAIPGPTSNPGSEPTFFNCWSVIPQGTQRMQRIGDKIMPIGMSLRISMFNKADRPNMSYRIIVCTMPKAVAGTTVSYNNTYPFQLANLGNNGNCMILPLDHDRGVKALYDRMISPNVGYAQDKEVHFYKKIWIKRKRNNPIIFNGNSQDIVNRPLLLYVIPYDSYGTLITDKIASFGYYCRMYYKDL